MRRPLVVSVLIVVGCGSSTPVTRPPGPAPLAPSVVPPVQRSPEREDFETATVGSAPPGWAVTATARNITFVAARGDAGNVLQIVTTGDDSASIKRPLEVAHYRGKRVLLSARGSCEPAGRRARATIGIDVARPGVRGYGDRTRTERIEQPAWQEYRTIIDVARDATGLDLVITSSMASTIRIDDIAISVLGDAGAGDEPPRALEGRALDNVVAFARLYGIVRYFHPSDEAAALDDAAWQRFVMRGVREVESARDAATLDTRLEKLFAPIAPAVKIYPEGTEAPSATPVTRPALHWIHRGVGVSKGSAYTSSRGTGDARAATTITTAIDPALVRGKELKVTLRARARLGDARDDAGLWISERRADSAGFYTEPEIQPAVGATWTEIPVQARISADATGLTLGVQVIGDAEAWLEVPVVTVDGKPLTVPGWGVRGSALAAAWERSGEGTNVAIGGEGCDRLRTCLHVSPKPIAPPDLRPWTGVLGAGVAASVPIELSTRDGKTVPAATASLAASDSMPLMATDRATRLAAVIVAWNVFQHFYPYFDVVGTSWMPELPRRLGEAALDDGPAALHTTLRRLVHQLHDGHGSVVHPGEDRSQTAPWLWEWAEGKLVITQISELCACDLARGDVVTAIDGVTIEQAVAGARALLSSPTEQFRSFRVLWSLRSGPEGSRRRLTIERNGVAHDVTAALIDPAAAPIEKRPESGDEVAPGIRYVDLDRVTGEQWKKILPALAAAKGIVLDARGYPNKIPLTTTLEHFTKKTLSSAQWHFPIPVRPDREGMTFVRSGWEVRPAAPFLGNVVFLTDGRAVSAAETYMGIVEAYKLGAIVGGATAGTNGNINPFVLPGGYLLSWTGMKVLKHDGGRHHGVGILPTIPASKTLAGIAAGRDEVLEKGIATVQRPSKASTKNARTREPQTSARDVR